MSALVRKIYAYQLMKPQYPMERAKFSQTVSACVKVPNRINCERDSASEFVVISVL